MLTVGGSFSKGWNANLSVHCPRSDCCSPSMFSYPRGVDLCSIMVGCDEIPDPEVEKTLQVVC